MKIAFTSYETPRKEKTPAFFGIPENKEEQ
jgi:hypothetical protein